MYRFALTGILLAGLPLVAQMQSFDLFRFQPPRGWKLIPGKDEFGMERLANNQFCQIGLYRALPSTGSAAQDFEKEWDTVKSRFQILEENPRESGQAEGWTLTNGSAAVEAAGAGKFVMTMQVYSGFGVRATVTMNMNHAGCKQEFQAFLGSMRLEAGRPGPSIFEAAAPAGGWISSAEANRELGAWPAELLGDYVQFQKQGMRVRIYHAMQITDAMRSRGDMRQNVWNQLVAPEFRSSEIRYWDNGPGATGPYATGGNFLIANAVESGNGRQVVVGMNYAAKNGLLYPIVGIAQDQATFNRFAGTPEQMEKLLRLNMFEIPARELNGRWTSNFTSAMEMYSVSTGIYAGVSVAAASMEIEFNNGTYQSRSKATVGQMGALTNAKDSEAGRYQLQGSMLTLMPQGKPQDAYLVWFEAVRGGMMLHLVNNQNRGNRWDLLRAK